MGTTDIELPILLVGHGKMGSAILRGLLDHGVAKADVLVVEIAEPSLQALAGLGVASVSRVEDIARDFRPRTILIAVKPQQMNDVLPLYRSFAVHHPVYLSVAAGIMTRAYEQALGADAAVVRAMPNTPAAVGRGMSVLFSNLSATEVQRNSCENLMRQVGDVLWITDEQLMDAVTALSGGGPAYVFLLIEFLANAGVHAGLDADVAMQLARSTVAGAGELARLSSESAAQLRINVTSPKGTTEAALRVLMREPGGLQELLSDAIVAARDRGIQLGK